MSEYHTGRLRIKKISPDNGWPEHWVLLWKFDEHDYWEEFGEAFLTSEYSEEHLLEVLEAR